MSYSVYFLVVAVIYIYMAIHTLSKDTKNIKNRLYFIVALLLAIWALINSALFLITEAEIAAFIRKYMVFSWGTMYSFVFHLIVILSGTIKIIKVQKRLAFFYFTTYAPALINIILYFFSPYPSTSLLLTKEGWIISDYFVDSFIWNYYFYIYYLTFMLSTLFVLFRWWKNADRRIEKVQAKLLAISFSVALVLGSLLEIVLPLLGFQIIYGITLFVVLFPVAAIWYAIENYSLMSFDPRKLTGEMLSLMSDGLILLGKDNRVEYLSHGASQILGFDQDQDLSLEDFGLTNIKPDLSSESMVFLNTEQESIEVLVNTLPIKDQLGEAYGVVLMFQDIREIKKSQKDLEELNFRLEDIILERTESLLSTNENLLKEIGMRRKAEEHIRHLAYYDYLTKLPNIRLFKKKVKRQIKLCDQTDKKFAMLFIDLDNFKTINDTLGHNKGDLLLQLVANRLNVYTKMNDKVTRNGGDEFLIMIEDDRDFEIQVKEITDIFKEPFDLEPYMLSITCSVGVAVYPDNGDKYEALIQSADIAMYEAKEAGGIKHRFFDQHMNVGLEETLELTNDLFQAIAENQLCLNYQPIVDSRSESIIGAEALLRWHHPTKGMISPLKFIPIAESTGLIDELTHFVLREVMAVIDDLELQKEDKFKLAINISAKQLNNEGFMKDFIDNSETYGERLKHIEFEVTENAFINNKDAARDILNKVNGLGIQIAIDDFGINYSSLNHIKQLPISKLKIDKVFVDGIGKNVKDEGIIITMITLASKLGLQLVAEGVEALEQTVFLKNNQCFNIQGYYYYKPMTTEAFKKLLIPE